MQDLSAKDNEILSVIEPKAREQVNPSAAIALTGSFLALALAFQFIGIQLLTGVAINALLICLASLRGRVPATFLGILTPLGAFLTGIMPIPLMIPFIALANLVILHTHQSLRNRGILIRIIVPALAKACSIYGSGLFLIRVLNFSGGAKMAVLALMLPQIITAMAGIVCGEFLASRIGGVRNGSSGGN